MRLLESARQRGTGYLVVPWSSSWWLDHYAELRDHLAVAGTVVVDESHCIVYDLGSPPGGASG